MTLFGWTRKRNSSSGDRPTWSENHSRRKAFWAKEVESLRGRRERRREVCSPVTGPAVFTRGNPLKCPLCTRRRRGTRGRGGYNKKQTNPTIYGSKTGSRGHHRTGSQEARNHSETSWDSQQSCTQPGTANRCSPFSFYFFLDSNSLLSCLLFSIDSIITGQLKTSPVSPVSYKPKPRESGKVPPQYLE